MPRGRKNETKPQKETNRKSNKKQTDHPAPNAAGKKNADGTKGETKEVADAAGEPKNGKSSAAAAKKVNKRLAKWEEEDNLILLEGWARDGLSMEQIAHNMGVSKKTLYNWCDSSLHILHAIKKGKEVTDYLVENALFTSALTGNVVAQIFWLKNRKPDKWKDKIEQVIDTEADTSGVVLLAPVLEKNHEPTEESDMGTTTQTD